MSVDYVNELKQRISNRGLGFLRTVCAEVDENYCARYYGIPTWQLKFKLGYPVSSHRLALNKLEKEGKVISYKQCENQLLWWPVGLLDEVRNGL